MRKVAIKTFSTQTNAKVYTKLRLQDKCILYIIKQNPPLSKQGVLKYINNIFIYLPQTLVAVQNMAPSSK